MLRAAGLAAAAMAAVVVFMTVPVSGQRSAVSGHLGHWSALAFCHHDVNRVNRVKQVTRVNSAVKQNERGQVEGLSEAT